MLKLIDYDKKSLVRATPMIAGNVLFVAFLFWLLDGIRRHFTIERPVKRINESLEKITKGDFTVNIKPLMAPTGYSEFNPIIDQINTMTKELASVETLKTDFISNVSHEIKTPLSVIQNYATMLQSPHLSEEERMEYAGAVSRASKRLSSLISNILKLNKLENQTLSLKKDKFFLSEQLCECLLQFEELWNEKEIEIETELDDSICIMADRELLSLVWNNLFSNALKFTPEKGKVRLRLYIEGDRAVTEVSDTGCGIDEETGRHIFDKFYQGDTSHATNGNGLGLALVKRVMDMTGGEIGVKSQVGKGSTFTVKLKLS
jgi:signal transduction histidine kinase